MIIRNKIRTICFIFLKKTITKSFTMFEILTKMTI